ncbi:hypothetical protein [Litchfieldia salsa]|nr:hypothetical protein [Litchfieldia salsa]
MMIVAGLIIMPITGAVHPLVKAEVIPNPGFFALGFGPIAGAFTFLGHVVYGLVLGILSKNIRGIILLTKRWVLSHFFYTNFNTKETVVRRTQ